LDGEGRVAVESFFITFQAKVLRAKLLPEKEAEETQEKLRFIQRTSLAPLAARLLIRLDEPYYFKGLFFIVQCATINSAITETSSKFSLFSITKSGYCGSSISRCTPTMLDSLPRFALWYSPLGSLFCSIAKSTFR